MGTVIVATTVLVADRHAKSNTTEMLCLAQICRVLHTRGSIGPPLDFLADLPTPIPFLSSSSSLAYFPSSALLALSLVGSFHSTFFLYFLNSSLKSLRRYCGAAQYKSNYCTWPHPTGHSKGIADVAAEVLADPTEHTRQGAMYTLASRLGLSSLPDSPIAFSHSRSRSRTDGLPSSLELDARRDETAGEVRKEGERRLSGWSWPGAGAHTDARAAPRPLSVSAEGGGLHWNEPGGRDEREDGRTRHGRRGRHGHSAPVGCGCEELFGLLLFGETVGENATFNRKIPNLSFLNTLILEVERFQKFSNR